MAHSVKGIAFDLFEGKLVGSNIREIKLMNDKIIIKMNRWGQINGMPLYCNEKVQSTIHMTWMNLTKMMLNKKPII